MNTHTNPGRHWRRWWPIVVGLTTALPSDRAQQFAGAQESRPPNVLLILTDDQGWGDLSLHGNPHLETPVLDRLAMEGARFDRFYVSPVCAPTRASLLTGRYHPRTGTVGVTAGLETMQSEEVTLAEVLRDAGFATGLFGKWHLGQHYPHTPQGQGFEEFLGFHTGHWNDYFDAKLEHNGRIVNTDGYISDVLTDAALRFVEENRDRPFFAYVAYNAPHTPIQVPARYYEKYRERGLDEVTAGIYGMIENLDDNVGRLLEGLDRLGLERNTIVIFLTDNGPNTDRYNGGMKGRKTSVHEGGVRVPFFVRWPGRIPEGRQVGQIAAHIDVLPTLVELTGVSEPRTLPLDGVSLAPLLRGDPSAWPERMIFSHRNRHRDWPPTEVPGSVRTPRYRLASTGDGWELYDMVADPGQQHDIAGAHPDVVGRLSGAYAQWFSDVTRGEPALEAIPVGHAEAPVVRLSASEAELSGGVVYANESGYAHDWVTGWTTRDGAVSWDLDVLRPGRYEVVLMHTAPPDAVGTGATVEAGGRSTRVRVDRAVPHEPSVRPDRDPRAHRLVKDFAPLEAGTLELPPGRTRLTVRLNPVRGQGIDLESIVLRRQEDAARQVGGYVDAGSDGGSGMNRFDVVPLGSATQDSSR